MKGDSAIKSLVVLTLICLVVTAALALTNNVTRPVIEAASAERETVARLEILPEADDFTEITNDAFSDAVASVYEANNGAGYVITTVVSGYGGDMTVMCGIGADGLITDTKVMSHNETPTLGGKVAESPYKDQFVGKDASLEGVDTISGTTISSLAFENAITEAFGAYEIVKGAK
jgi:electron transport complex protein RnfG